MRAFVVVLVLAAPTATLAQPAPPQPPPGGPRTITRDQFIQRAAQAAGRRFDTIDVNHAGYVTVDQLRAWRQAHGVGGGGNGQPQE